MPDPAMLMDAVVGAGNLADLAGSLFRDLKYGKSLAESVDQFATPLSSENRTTGRDLIRDYGWTDKKDESWEDSGYDDSWESLAPTWKNFAGGLAAEMALDPLTYTGIGAGWRPAHRLAKAALANRAMRASVPVSRKVPRGFTTEAPRGLMKQISPPAAAQLKDSLFLHTTSNSPAVLRQGLKSRKQLGGTSGALGGGPSNAVSVTYDPARAAAIERALSAHAGLLRGEITPSEAARAYGGGAYMSAAEPRGDLLFSALESSGRFGLGPKMNKWITPEGQKAMSSVERDWDQFSKYLDEAVVSDLEKKNFADMLDHSFPSGGAGWSPELAEFFPAGRRYYADVMGEPADLARINPRNIKTYPVAIRKTALDAPGRYAPRTGQQPGRSSIPWEQELRLSPEDVHVLADPLLNLQSLPPAGQFKGAGSAGAAALGARFGGNQ